MRFGNIAPAALLILLPICCQIRHGPSTPGQTLLSLKDAETGRTIARESLSQGEEVVLTWRNSLFNLMVEEIFVVEGGRLKLTKVTFQDPRGMEPPLAKPEDLDDLYHTGGPFRVEGLSRPFTRLVFRVGEIGNPRLRIGKRVVEFAKEAGFGGAVVLTVEESVRSNQ